MNDLSMLYPSKPDLVTNGEPITRLSFPLPLLVPDQGGKLSVDFVQLLDAFIFQSHGDFHSHSPSTLSIQDNPIVFLQIRVSLQIIRFQFFPARLGGDQNIQAKENQLLFSYSMNNI